MCNVGDINDDVDNSQLNKEAALPGSSLKSSFDFRNDTIDFLSVKDFSENIKKNNFIRRFTPEELMITTAEVKLPSHLSKE